MSILLHRKYFCINRTEFIHASTGDSPEPQPSIYSLHFFNTAQSFSSHFTPIMVRNFPEDFWPTALYIDIRSMSLDNF